MKFDLDLVLRIATLTNEDVANLPHIHIPNEGSLNNLMAWRDANKDLVRTFKPVVNEGIISMADTRNIQYFNQNGQDVFHMYKMSEEEYIAFSYNLDTWVATPIADTITFYPTDQATQDMITVHASTMAYLQDLGLTALPKGIQVDLNVKAVR